MNIKHSARTVIYDQENLLALIDVRDGEYFKIPGGGIEKGETLKQAAIREALEETGCDIKLFKKIGENNIVDESKNIIYHSICYLAQKIKTVGLPSFDDWEKINQMKVIWVDFNQAIKLFKSATPKDFISSKINQRDLKFVLLAKEILNL
jgi:8-oxo-dGTP pyrophosphatase MutT (NUDIX family)